MATDLAAGRVKVDQGGGELGRGFYTGEHLYEAKAWAFSRTGDKQNNVVEFVTPEDQIESLSILPLDRGTAALHRARIKQLSETRTYKFSFDLVWAPIVGSERVTGDQFKWESSQAGALLNGNDSFRNVL